MRSVPAKSGGTSRPSEGSTVREKNTPDDQFVVVAEMLVGTRQSRATSLRQRSTPQWVGQQGRKVDFSDICVPSVAGGVVGHEHQLSQVAYLDNPLASKGNYIVFPLKEQCYLTTYILMDFVKGYLGALDGDSSDSFDAENFDHQWVDAANNPTKCAELREQLIKYITAVRRSDEIIVPTGQLFVERLPSA